MIANSCAEGEVNKGYFPLINDRGAVSVRSISPLRALGGTGQEAVDSYRRKKINEGSR